MAKKKTGKPAGKTLKEKLQLTLEPEIAHRLRLAALGSRMDVSEFVTQWILREFSGLHIRGLEKQTEQQPAAGQGGSDELSVVRINSTTNRIADVARSSTAPVDDAIDSLTGYRTR